jgi:hypothetical protein
MNLLAPRSRRALPIAAAAFLLAGCAALGLTPAFTIEQRLERGLAQLSGEEVDEGYALLHEIATAYSYDELGQRALLALAAWELDPRNPRRRLWAAADLSALYLGADGVSSWTVPVAETLYLLAQELGAVEERAARAEEQARAAEQRAREAEARARAAARQPPQFRGTTVPARVQAAAGERDQLAARVRELEQTVAAQRQELERIRQTLRP